MAKNKLSNIFKGDKVIWFIFFLLAVVSIVEVYSASSQLTYKHGNYFAPITKHIGFIFLGGFAIVLTLNIKCKYFKILTPFLLIFTFATLIWALVAGESTNGASRWVGIFGMQFQPSEIAKGTLVLTTAQILSALQTDKGADPKAFKYICLVAGPILFLILLENLSTAFLLGLVVILMMVIGRVSSKSIGSLLGLIALVGLLGFAAIMLFGETEQPTDSKQQLTEQVVKKKEKPSGIKSVFHRFDTWKARIENFAQKKHVEPDEVDLDKDAQTAHANIAIASSNIIGKGPGKSDERDFLSQAFSDFIYAIVIEELGIGGAIVVALLYIILLFRVGYIAKRCENTFPAFLIMGLALLLVTQALFNMCVAVGLVPVTGQPLPLVSRGGTSTIVNCIYIGAILSVSRTAKKKNPSRRENASGKLAVA